MEGQGRGEIKDKGEEEDIGQRKGRGKEEEGGKGNGSGPDQVREEIDALAIGSPPCACQLYLTVLGSC